MKVVRVFEHALLLLKHLYWALRDEMFPIVCLNTYRRHAWGSSVVATEVPIQPYIGNTLKQTCARCGVVSYYTPSER